MHHDLGCLGAEINQSAIDRQILKLKEAGFIVSTGIFGADMKVSILNDGPVTILIESRYIC